MERRKLYTANEAAYYLGVSISTLKKWEGLGKIVSIKIPGSNQSFFPQEQIDKALWKLDRRILV
jgi:predicted site-specific integrase-resolvase